ncbi:DUF4097 domain-containing protein [Lysinibacillus piscis]|uniref:DUF4097 domain-containing protein n=1 Tax=Lysinibacillus piscis TaxID=2518931 RepID=A0ABQ5NF66_9BACI|nr:DUF4097 domain-containing protein [Lysinibacillus sp. KH24]GLC87043.1 hypothetical protein LYSBPC_01700 [Lysinibacillus sp. KH24]
MFKRSSWLAGCIILLGILLAGFGYISGGKWFIFKDDTGFHVPAKTTLEKNVYETENFSNIQVISHNSDVQIKTGDHFALETHTVNKDDVSFHVKDNTLTVTTPEAKKNTFEFGIGNFHSSSITIYVPKDTKLHTVDIATSFGDTTLQHILYQQLLLDSGSGDITLQQTDGETTTIEQGFGDITARNITGKTLQIENQNGDITIGGTIIDSATITSSFGDITLHLQTSRQLTVHSNNGDIAIDGLLNGLTAITSSFGDINLQLQNKQSALGFDLQTQFGDITVNQKSYSNQASQVVTSDQKLTISSDNGDIELSFVK